MMKAEIAIPSHIDTLNMRIMNPASTAHMIMLNGLCTRDAVEDSESSDEGCGEPQKGSQSTRIEYRFFGIHLNLLSSTIPDNT